MLALNSFSLRMYLATFVAPAALAALGACAASSGSDASQSDDVEAASSHRDAGSSSSSSSSGGSTSGGGGGQSCTPLNGKADLRCTPGVFNADVTQATIGSTICVSGWTSTVRPPSAYTTGLKNQQKTEYGETAIANADLEEDHLVPLELGGNPTDPKNLWPQPRQSVAPSGQGAETKDAEETQLKQAVCSGQMTLDAARQKMLFDWTH